MASMVHSPGSMTTLAAISMKTPTPRTRQPTSKQITFTGWDSGERNHKDPMERSINREKPKETGS